MLESSINSICAAFRAPNPFAREHFGKKKMQGNGKFVGWVRG